MEGENNNKQAFKSASWTRVPRIMSPVQLSLGKHIEHTLHAENTGSQKGSLPPIIIIHIRPATSETHLVSFREARVRFPTQCAEPLMRSLCVTFCSAHTMEVQACVGALVCTAEAGLLLPRHWGPSSTLHFTHLTAPAPAYNRHPTHNAPLQQRGASRSDPHNF